MTLAAPELVTMAPSNAKPEAAVEGPAQAHSSGSAGNGVNDAAAKGPTKRGLFWALFPVGLLGSMVTGLLVMASIASRDPSFALEQDYYAKAVHYDDEVAQRGRNQALGWRANAEEVQPSRVILSLSDGQGTPIAGAVLRVEAIENAHASRRHSAAVTALDGGRYQLEMPNGARGIWELRISANRGTELFTQSIRVEFERSHDSQPGRETRP
ncbi:MAG TPA: FixH family protein [Polyangiaceae bacterium]|nr:FixH family protein [Polyangiaceae bacterium]